MSPSLRRFVIPCGGLLLGMTLAGCSARVPVASPAAARQALMDADRAFATETAADGLEGWMRFYAPDAVRLRMGETAVQGLDAVRRFDAGIFADASTRLVWWPTDSGTFEDRRLGFTTGRSALVRAEAPADTLWRQDAQGRWKVILDTGASR